MQRQILLKFYCCCKEPKDQPDFCVDGIDKPDIHCFQPFCDHLAIAHAPHELVYSGETGLVEDESCSTYTQGHILPDGVAEDEMEARKKSWKEICTQKIEEVQREHMGEAKYDESEWNARRMIQWQTESIN